MVLDRMRNARRLAVDPDLQAPEAPLSARVRRVTPIALVVDSDPRSLLRTSEVLEWAGMDVLPLRSVMEAWDMLRIPGQVDLLVTRMLFGPGLPNGVALGLHARHRDAALPVLYTPFTVDLATLADPVDGAILPLPFSAMNLIRTAWRLVSPVPGLAAG